MATRQKAFSDEPFDEHNDGNGVSTRYLLPVGNIKISECFVNIELNNDFLIQSASYKYIKISPKLIANFPREF